MTAARTPPLWAVVMAGGSGTRFWPVSRAGRPKQFLPPGGGIPGSQGKKSSRNTLRSGDNCLLSDTVKRIKGLVANDRILVIASAGHRRLIREALPQIPPRNIVLEPEGRNTAPCLGLAAHLIERREPGALMAAFPADHHIARPAGLRRLIRTAARLVREGDAIVTLGMKPDGPETGYGYIQRGKRLPGGSGAYTVRRFTEKPSRARARKFIAAGSYYWNGGIFVWRAARAIEEIARRIPRTARALDRAAAARQRRNSGEFARAFRACESISIDHAVMERARNLLVLPAEIGWSDVGSWPALRGVLPLDGKGNLWMLPRGAAAHAEDAEGLIVRSAKPLVAALGVRDLIVVETEDALFLCRSDRAQSVGDLVKSLRRKGLGRFLR